MRRSIVSAVCLLGGALGCGSPKPNDADPLGGAGGPGTPGIAPVLVPGVWTNISPPSPLKSEDFGGSPAGGVLTVALDPSDPLTLYTAIEHTGIWKTTDGGTSWVQLGPTPDEDIYDAKTNQLEVPIGIAVDPSDPSHLYAVAGVRDNNN